MKRILSSFFIFLIFFCSAQNEEAIYLQQEHDRLARVSNHEIAIQDYINQNITNYNLPFTITNRINTQKHEDGSDLTQSEKDEKLLDAKQQQLRIQYLSENPVIVADYNATTLTLATACINNGFENGDTSGFSFFSQRFNPWYIYNNFPVTSVTPQPTGIITL